MLRNGSYNRTVFSMWSVPRLYDEIPRITKGVTVSSMAIVSESYAGGVSPKEFIVPRFQSD
jgi:hypothetical protein